MSEDAGLAFSCSPAFSFGKLLRMRENVPVLALTGMFVAAMVTLCVLVLSSHNSDVVSNGLIQLAGTAIGGVAGLAVGKGMSKDHNGPTTVEATTLEVTK